MRRLHGSLAHPQSLALSGPLKKVVRFSSYPAYKPGEPLMLLEGLDVGIGSFEFRLGQ